VQSISPPKESYPYHPMSCISPVSPSVALSLAYVSSHNTAEFMACYLCLSCSYRSHCCFMESRGSTKSALRRIPVSMTSPLTSSFSLLQMCKPTLITLNICYAASFSIVQSQRYFWNLEWLEVLTNFLSSYYVVADVCAL